MVDLPFSRVAIIGLGLLGCCIANLCNSTVALTDVGSVKVPVIKAITAIDQPSKKDCIVA